MSELAARYGDLHEAMETAGRKLMLNALHRPLAAIQRHLQNAEGATIWEARVHVLRVSVPTNPLFSAVSHGQSLRPSRMAR